MVISELTLDLQSIFTDQTHLTDCVLNTDYVSNYVSGAVYAKHDDSYQMLIPNNQCTTTGLVLPDTNRLPNMVNRGETLHINPYLLKAARQWGDKLGNPTIYQLVTEPARYARYKVEPAGESPYNEKMTPVDLLIEGLSLTLLHEVNEISPYLFIELLLILL